MTPPVDLDRLEDKWSIKDGSSARRAEWAAAIAELRELRAWRARLGTPADWFPHLAGQGCWNESMWLLELRSECHALLERAKETPQ